MSKKIHGPAPHHHGPAPHHHGHAPHHHGPAPHHHGPAPHHHGPAPHHHGHAPHHESNSFAGYFGENAGGTLAKMLSADFVSWLLRAISYGPPEMRSIFKVQIATIAREIHRRELAGEALPQFTREDLIQGEAVFSALAEVVPEPEVAQCIGGLFTSPEEVNAIAYVMLLSLHLSSHPDMVKSEGPLDE
jgi:hypothetical protein